MEALKKITEYINNNLIQEAFELIMENEERLGDIPEFWNAKAILCIRVREYETALGCLKKVLNKDSTNADAYYNLAYVCEKMGLNSDAAIYYGLAQKYTEDPELVNELQNIYAENMILKDIKDVMVHSEKKTFIILSSCGWGDVLQRMHHISRSLVKLGQEVFYVSPTANVTLSSEETKLSTVVEYILKNEKIMEGVRVYQPLNVSSSEKFLFNSYTALVQRLIDSSNEINEVVLVAYMPYQVEVIKALQGKFKVIYECVDDHTDLEYAFWGNKKDVVWEQELMDISDAITTTATSLYLQRVSIEGRKNVYLSRNAVNEADFIFGYDEIPADLKDIPEPRIVYMGAIYKWFDIDLFYEVVKSNPDKSFVIIGFGQEDMFKERCPNLYLLGAKKHSELKKYLQHMQIGIIPFKDDTDIIMNCDPIKQYEYLACGLPVITTCMPESALNKIYSIHANTKEQFNDAIATTLCTVIDRNILSGFLVRNSWNYRAVLLCHIVDNSEKQVVVSETNEEIKRELSIIIDHTPHPNFLILYALTLNLEDKNLFVEYAEKAFHNLKTPYIERQFLLALYLNNRHQDFVENAIESKNIAPYLISELSYRVAVNDTSALETIMLFSINRYTNANTHSLLLISSSERDLISGLYYFLLGNYERTFSFLNKISEQRIIKESPLYNYLSNYAPVVLMAYKGIEEKKEEDTGEGYVNIHWLMTFGCNFNCPYCTMSHARSTGHAFDYERPLEWAKRFNNLDRPFSLYITGGEPLLDIVNFTQFYNNIIGNKNLRHIRIDTNGSISPEKLNGLVVQKTILNVSFHPTQIELSKLISNLEGYRNLGFSVEMVNMVCKEEDVETYKEYSKFFREKKFILNLGIYIGGQYPKENKDIESFTSVLDKLDVGFKTKVFSPKGFKCNSSKFFKSMLPDGSLKDCWRSSGNFLKNNISTDKVAKECPFNECTCIEQYSLLPIFNRNPQASLKGYIDQSILAPQERKTKIVSIIGYFGDDNAGDEALLTSILERLKIYPAVQPIVIAFANSENVTRLYNVLAVNGQDFDRVTQVLHMSDLVILGPGGLLEDYAALDAKNLFNKQGMYSYLYPVLLSQLYGKHTVGYGLGVGPLKMDESRNAVRLALRGMEKVFVRDRYSFSLLKEIELDNVEISADAVLNLEPLQVTRTTYRGDILRGSKGRVGISLRPFIGVDSDTLIKQISILIEYLVEKLDFNCIIFPMQYGYDMPLIKRLYSILPNNIKSQVFILEERLHPKSLMSLISSMNIVIGMRLHSLIMASTANVPFIALSYDPKVSEFAKSAKMADYIIDINNISTELLIEKVKKLMIDGKIIKEYAKEIKSLKDSESRSWDYIVKQFLIN